MVFYAWLVLIDGACKENILTWPSVTQDAHVGGETWLTTSRTCDIKNANLCLQLTTVLGCSHISDKKGKRRRLFSQLPPRRLKASQHAISHKVSTISVHLREPLKLKCTSLKSHFDKVLIHVVSQAAQLVPETDTIPSEAVGRFALVWLCPSCVVCLEKRTSPRLYHASNMRPYVPLALMLCLICTHVACMEKRTLSCTSCLCVVPVLTPHKPWQDLIHRALTSSIPRGHPSLPRWRRSWNAPPI